MAAEPTDSDPLAPDPQRDIVLDTAALRVLAHPMRLSFLHYLRDHGPATGRRLAAHFELDSGAVSYHLRKLADGGLIEEDVERGTRRDRWWRVMRPVLYHDPATREGDDEQEDNRAYLHSTLLAYGDALRRYAVEVPRLSQDWLNVTMTSERPLRLTPAQLTELKRDLVAVIDRYRDLPDVPDVPDQAGAQPISIHIHALPPPER